VARVVALSTGDEVGVEAFVGTSNRPGTEPVRKGARSLTEQIEALERSAITVAMEAVSGNKSEAARRLGLSRGALIDRLKKYELSYVKLRR